MSDRGAIDRIEIARFNSTFSTSLASRTRYSVGSSRRRRLIRSQGEGQSVGAGSEGTRRGYEETRTVVNGRRPTGARRLPGNYETCFPRQPRRAAGQYRMMGGASGSICRMTPAESRKIACLRVLHVNP